MKAMSILVAAAAVPLTAAAFAIALPRDRQQFDHEQHASLFPSCITCHAGVQEAGAPLWPSADGCAACHDGVIEERVAWSVPVVSPASNLRFDHQSHANELATEGREPAECIDCHARTGSPWMSVERSAVPQCLECHDIQTSHFDAPDAACANCHVTLAEASRLSEDQIMAFEAPSSHEAADFATASHGAAATAAGGTVAASCATCHARDFCITCHVDAPEQPVVQALAADPRSTVITAGEITAPASHAVPSFLTAHGSSARADAQACRTCHTQESCLTCHVSTPEVAQDLFVHGPGRGVGAQTERQRPASHDATFIDRHGSSASTTPATCAACHAREECLNCHRPNTASAPSYHDANFLTRHPSAAYVRETTCSECHNPRTFCATCHLASGLTSQAGLIGAGFHDAKRGFIAGHGPAARRSLESCITCHTETDCLSCHSAVGGRRFNPHGPGFDAERLRARAPDMCAACHGSNIPGS